MDVKRLNIGVSLLVSAVVATAAMAATWGAYTNRLEVVEGRSVANQRELNETRLALVRTEAQYAEILRRLDRIERRLKDDGFSQESRN